MEQEFWHNRWNNNEIGFHQETVNPYLQRYWSRLQLKHNAAVLVPCCGKSLDLLWLKEQGMHVKGIEISPLAVDAFFAENKLSGKSVQQGKFKVTAIDKLELLCGDFFNLTEVDLNGISVIYDRASMIAMPLAMRRSYCQHLQVITAKKIPIFLVTLEYNENEMQGPPFSITEEEVREIYSSDYMITVLETAEILDGNDYFKERGLTRLQERCYWLMPN